MRPQAQVGDTVVFTGQGQERFEEWIGVLGTVVKVRETYTEIAVITNNDGAWTGDRMNSDHEDFTVVPPLPRGFSEL